MMNISETANPFENLLTCLLDLKVKELASSELVDQLDGCRCALGACIKDSELRRLAGYMYPKWSSARTRTWGEGLYIDDNASVKELMKRVNKGVHPGVQISQNLIFKENDGFEGTRSERYKHMVRWCRTEARRFQLLVERIESLRPNDD